MSAVEAFYMISGRVIGGFSLLVMFGAAILTVLTLLMPERLAKAAAAAWVIAITLWLSAAWMFHAMDGLAS